MFTKFEIFIIISEIKLVVIEYELFKENVSRVIQIYGSMPYHIKAYCVFYC